MHECSACSEREMGLQSVGVTADGGGAVSGGLLRKARTAGKQKARLAEAVTATLRPNVAAIPGPALVC